MPSISCTLLAWNAINNLTGRSTQFYRPCPISANSTASQLVKNGTYKTNNRGLPDSCSRKCLSFGGYQRQLTNVSPATSPRKNLPDPRQKARQKLQVNAKMLNAKPAKARQSSRFRFHMPRADNPCRCCPEVLVKQFSFFLHAPTTNSKNLEESVGGCHPKADEATRGGKKLKTYFFAMCPL